VFGQHQERAGARPYQRKISSGYEGA
jgi:hypothetical protein